MSSLIDAHGLDLDTPDGRPLVRQLGVQLGRERVALVGRNGVGKSTLLRVLAGEERPTRGTVSRSGRVLRVAQDLAHPADKSPGERRRIALEAAFRERPDLLLLDEPTEDLDTEGRRYLFAQLDAWRGGLVVISHDRELLSRFDAFFVMEEAGCHLFTGTVRGLLLQQRAEQARREEAYLRALRHLEEEEEKHHVVSQRRKRKKAVGRIHELDRSQSRMRLNQRRSAAQVSQGRVRLGADARIAAQREIARAVRRALSVDLPLSAVVPSPAEGQGPALVADGLSAAVGGRALVRGLDLSVSRERIALIGPNGAGKTTLLETLLLERPAADGHVRCDLLRVGWIAQGAENWRVDESLVAHLARYVDADGIAARLAAHRFPLALAERPLASLSPGERTRAAVIAVFERPELELLALDEPTRCLDLVGGAALAEALASWRGGLLVASHDTPFLDEIGIERTIALA